MNSGVIYLTVVSEHCHNSYLMRFSPAAHLPACCQSPHSSALSSVYRLHALAALTSMNDAISISRNSVFFVTVKSLIHWTLVQLELRWVCETISPFSAFDHSFDSRDLPLIPFSTVVWRPFLVHNHVLNIVFVIVLYQILWDICEEPMRSIFEVVIIFCALWATNSDSELHSMGELLPQWEGHILRAVTLIDNRKLWPT